MKKTLKEQLTDLFNYPLTEVLQQAWQVRGENFPAEVLFAAPSAKTYEIAVFRNSPNKFVNISLTGKSCALQCDHCRGYLLQSMLPAVTPRELVTLGNDLAAQGCTGVLISGGANPHGQVELDRFLEAIADIKNLGLRVIVHSGLLTRETARGLKQAGVEQVLLDIIGDQETIAQVYHLDKQVRDYYNSLVYLREEGLPSLPHIVVGLHFGVFKGELEALRMITEVGAAGIVLVVLNPLPGTGMAEVTPPEPELLGKLAAAARILNPATKIMLGCARPPALRRPIEALALRAGVNGIAYPIEETVALAEELGLKWEFQEICCSLL